MESVFDECSVVLRSLCLIARTHFTSTGLSGPSSFVFSPKRVGCDKKYLVFVSTSSRTSASRRLRSGDNSSGLTFTSANERQLCSLDLSNFQVQPLLRLPSKRRFDSEPASSSSPSSSSDVLSLEERLRRERQRLHSSGGLTRYSWCWHGDILRLVVPIRGSVYVQDGMDSYLKVAYDKHSLENHQYHNSNSGIYRSPASGVATGAIDPQLSPDGSLLAFCVLGEIFIASCEDCQRPVQVTFGADLDQSITHGLADFVAQEEMDRYRGFWWAPDSRAILFARVDESMVAPYRIIHHESDSGDAAMYEDHRYPFAGKSNPSVRLGYVKVDAQSLLMSRGIAPNRIHDSSQQPLSHVPSPDSVAAINWEDVIWFDPPREASEYLARVSWLPDGCACAQWQNRTQNCLVLSRLNFATKRSRALLIERSNVWINLHQLLHVLDRPIHPNECLGGSHHQRSSTSTSSPPLFSPLVSKVSGTMPTGSCSFLFGSERSGYCHLYLYTYIPNVNGDQAMLLRQVSCGDWMVESIVGVRSDQNVVYVTGTFDSVLERHLYALPLVLMGNRASGGSVSNVVNSSSFVGTSHMQFKPGMEDDSQLMDLEPSMSSPNGVRRGLKHVMNALSGKSSSNHQGLSFGPVSGRGGFRLSSATSLVLENMPESFVDSPIRLTAGNGMHNVVMDHDCTLFVDTSSDLGRPTSVKVYEIPEGGPFAGSLMTGSSASGSINGSGKGCSSHSRRKQQPPDDAFTAGVFKSQLVEVRSVFTLYDAVDDDKSMDASDPTVISNLPAPDLLTVQSSDGTETLHAALYRPDARIFGPGPYPLICAVYGGPHVQRVNRSWSQCADMRAQRLRSLGFCVVKCDNRGSSRRGLAFESAISRRLGRLEVLDQVAVVRQLTVRGIADPSRVGIYGWSYGGYLSAMCLCRAPDVFHVAVAGAPVTSWDGYDTHYTERYMGLPSENPNGYRESAVFDHVPNMRGRLLLVHGLIDENVHFRHTARLINRLIAAGKDYDLLLFPDERHSPRRLRDRIYMEQRISDYFLKHLGVSIKAKAGL